MRFNPEDKFVGQFTESDGTIDFYLRISSLTSSESVVLDLGAGRAAWFEDDNCKVRKEIRHLKGKVNTVVAADLDEAVLQNRASDKQVVIKGGVLDLEPESVDVIIADYVLEHVDDPKEFYSQINSCLKSGGWFCARTPHKYSYISIAASLVKNSLHSNFLKLIQPDRKEVDIFPTRYKLNKLIDIKKTFKDWENKTFIFRGNPAYYFGNKYIYLLQSVMHRILPAFASGNIFVFVRKP